MIYTLTLNPSVDYLLFLQQFDLHKTNRSNSEQKYPGGKGINVSRLLTRLDVENTALGFIGGFTGQWIIEQLNGENQRQDFIAIQNETRTNIKLKVQTGKTKEIEVNAMGPEILAAEQNALKHQFQQFKEGDVVILSGNVQSSLPADFYTQLIALFAAKNILFVLDTTGNALKDNLKHRPFLIKPNHEELEELMEKPLNSKAEIIAAGQHLLALGAQNVLISLGAKGAYLLTPNAVYEAQAPKGQLINSVGAGDSMVAGFVAEYQKTKNEQKALTLSIACGSATAFSADLATATAINALLPQVNVIQL